MQLHPINMKKLPKNSFVEVAENIYSIYEVFLPNFMAEVTTS